MLIFFNRVGFLLYIDEDELRNIVIFDVYWFVGVFKCVIVDLIEIEEIINKELIIFYEIGELNDYDLDNIWSKYDNKKEKYFDYKDKILLYMEYMGLLIICNIENFGIDQGNISKIVVYGVWYYFFSMNK